MKKFNYFYEIKNNINGHFYYGIHSTNNLEDGYMGSGIRLHYAYKKYGIENFTKTILKYFDSRKDASDYEAEIVTEELIKNDECYNIRLGGDDGKTIGCVAVLCEDGKYHDIPKENLTENSQIIYKGLVPTFQGMIPKEIYNKDREKYTHLSQNKVTVKDKQGNFYAVDKNDDRYVNGELVPIWRGWKHKEETKEKMRKSLSLINHQQGEKNSQYGKCWVYIVKDGKIENKSIKKEDLETYLSNGWIKGRKIKMPL